MNVRTKEYQMLNVERKITGVEMPQSVDLHRYVALFRRRMRLFVSIGVAVFISFMIIVLQLPKQYTSVAEVMLDPRQHNVTSVQEVLSGLPADTTAVDTEVEVLKSRSLAEKVVSKLHLDQDKEFNTALEPKPFWQALIPQLPPSRQESAEVAAQEAHNAIVDRVMKHLKVARLGLTFAISVGFVSKDPQKSTMIANAFADSYLVEQLDAKFDATRRASDWLNARLSALKGQVEQAEASVAEYKGAHGLMGLSSSEGGTIAQQEISTINTQLATAKAQQAEAEANLATARQQMALGSNGDDLGASLSSTVIEQLRTQRAQISGQVADMAGRLGPRHPEMLKAQRQLADIDAQIQSEIKRISSNLEAQAQVAKQRTASIQSSLSQSRGALAANGTASVQLNNLQRNADSLSTLYQTYLDRFKQTSNQQGLEQSDSRVVSQAKIPNAPSFPNIPIFAILGIMIAAVAAVTTLFVVEALESGLYTSEDVEKLLGVSHLGSIPTANSTLKRGESTKLAANPTSYVIDKPLSSFAEAFRNLKLSVLHSRLDHVIQVIAVTSALPGEGKTTTSVCLGRVIAAGGVSTVIVDCDLRRRSVNRLLIEEPKFGLLEVLSGEVSLEQALVHDEESNAFILPLAKHEYTPKDVFASLAMDRVLEQLRARFEIVLLDTAPILPVADTKTLAPKADAVVFLAQWRRTPRKATENAIKQLEAVGAFVAGVGLTQVDMHEQARSGYGDAGYYYRSYNSYYSH